MASARSSLPWNDAKEEIINVSDEDDNTGNANNNNNSNAILCAPIPQHPTGSTAFHGFGTSRCHREDFEERQLLSQSYREAWRQRVLDLKCRHPREIRAQQIERMLQDSSRKLQQMDETSQKLAAEMRQALMNLIQHRRAINSAIMANSLDLEALLNSMTAQSTTPMTSTFDKLVIQASLTESMAMPTMEGDYAAEAGDVDAYLHGSAFLARQKKSAIHRDLKEIAKKRRDEVEQQFANNRTRPLFEGLRASNAGGGPTTEHHENNNNNNNNNNDNKTTISEASLTQSEIEELLASSDVKTSSILKAVNKYKEHNKSFRLKSWNVPAGNESDDENEPKPEVPMAALVSSASRSNNANNSRVGMQPKQQQQQQQQQNSRSQLSPLLVRYSRVLRQINGNGDITMQNTNTAQKRRPSSANPKSNKIVKPLRPETVAAYTSRALPSSSAAAANSIQGLTLGTKKSASSSAASLQRRATTRKSPLRLSSKANTGAQEILERHLGARVTDATKLLNYLIDPPPPSPTISRCFSSTTTQAGPQQQRKANKKPPSRGATKKTTTTTTNANNNNNNNDSTSQSQNKKTMSVGGGGRMTESLKKQLALDLSSVKIPTPRYSQPPSHSSARSTSSSSSTSSSTTSSRRSSATPSEQQANNSHSVVSFNSSRSNKSSSDNNSNDEEEEEEETNTYEDGAFEQEAEVKISLAPANIPYNRSDSLGSEQGGRYANVSMSIADQ